MKSIPSFQNANRITKTYKLRQAKNQIYIMLNNGVNVKKPQPKKAGGGLFIKASQAMPKAG